MAKRLPAAPKAWAKAARDLWRDVHAAFDLDTHHRILLEQACELLTRAADARKLLAEQGLMVTDRYGTGKPNPLIDVERNSINAARLVLRELGLDFDEGGAVTSPEERVRIHRAKGYA